MSARLYYDDAYLKQFRARITGGSGRKLLLDRSAFYPSSGGQPHDLGSINGVAVLNVEEDDSGLVWHHTAEDIREPEVDCTVDWSRRFDHMQQHSGQHLLSAVLERLFGFPTISFHMGSELSTIDIASPGLSAAQIREAEHRCAGIVFENRPVVVDYEDSAAAEGLRKPSDRTGTLRIVSIEGIDRSACGGTHVRSAGEIGPVMIRGIGKIRGNARIEFVCGLRALARARRDQELLAAIAQIYSTGFEEAPAAASAQQSRLVAAEKARARLAGELAELRGKEMYRNADDSSGVRRHVRRLTVGSLDEEIRAEARGFTGEGRGVYIAALDNPPSLLVAVSPDAGLNAGAALKQVMQRYGGKGGGSAQVAQGSVPDGLGLDQAIAELSAAFGL